jgi:hypothetical protein
MSIYNVQYTKKPFVTLQGIDDVLLWEEGSLLLYRMKSSALQLTATSLQYYSGDSLRGLETWNVFRCTPAVGALCKSVGTKVTLMGTSPVIVPYDISGPMSASPFLQAFNGSVCNSQGTGRSLGPSDVYTVSVCDLTERMLRFVVSEAEDGMSVYWKSEEPSVSENVILACIALYASVNIANNTVYLIATTNSERPTSNTGIYNIFLLTGTSVTLLLICQNHAHYYVSSNDYNLYTVMYVFLVLEVSLLFLKLTRTNRKVEKMQGRFHFGYNINLSTTILLLTTLRLHKTFSTPFFGILFAFFGIRTFCKLIQQLDDFCRSHHSHVNAISVLVDLFAWSCLLAYGLAIAGDVYGQLAVAVNVIVGFIFGLAMSILIERKRTRACNSK